MTLALSRSHSSAGLMSESVYFIRRSRSLASMLPSLLLSGLLTAVVTAVMLFTIPGTTENFISAWLESWLITWPIAFPVTYLVGPALIKFAIHVSSPAQASSAQAAIDAIYRPGLGLGDITGVSDRVTANNGWFVLRKLKPVQDFKA